MAVGGSVTLPPLRWPCVPHAYAANWPNASPRCIASPFAVGDRPAAQFFPGSTRTASAYVEGTRSPPVRPRQAGLPKVCVAVDPPGGATECGIVVAGRAHVDGQDHFYVLEDASDALTPNGWGRRVIDSYHLHSADKVIGEGNYGGDMVESVIRHNDPEPVVRTRPCRPRV